MSHFHDFIIRHCRTQTMLRVAKKKRRVKTKKEQFKHIKYSYQIKGKHTTHQY